MSGVALQLTPANASTWEAQGGELVRVAMRSIKVTKRGFRADAELLVCSYSAIGRDD
ncbi:hypothetical protein CERZMDRAFT_112467 [Cercospora zeae-maydis SCOH1-5]|uniref:Uncharacterized protein n=1 Tax=Cercospora zeae-maydis SCOH1-5 TaxID=717836 RepID=A0A6A6FEI8_9PEZI|nr:hypothetical protein CERZMDRAFT_112467 [Cercospora zeae-maydis SCOH1-5]